MSASETRSASVRVEEICSEAKSSIHSEPSCPEFAFGLEERIATMIQPIAYVTEERDIK
jgi:hypothetical protein